MPALTAAETVQVEKPPKRPRARKQRDPNAPRRHRLLWLLGIVAVLLLTLSIVAWLVGGKPTQPTTAPAPPATVLTAAGATTVIDGVPVGYPHTAPGAVAAAANHLQALGSVRMYDPAQRRAIVAQVSGQQAFADQAESVVSRAAQALGVDAHGRSPEGDVVSMYLPERWRLVRVDSGSATVDIWSQSVVGIAGPLTVSVPTAAWSMDRVTLVWTGDWKIAKYEELPPVVPVGGIQKPSPSELIAQTMRDFQPFSIGD